MFFVFPKIIKPDVCEDIIKECKENVLEEALLGNPNIEDRNNPDIRKTSIHFIKDKDDKVNKIAWHFLKEANKKEFHYALEYFQPIQFAEYKDGGHYGWHRDAGPFTTGNTNAIRKLSLTLALSDPDTFEGGELQFYNGDRPVDNVGEITGEQVTNDIKSQGSIIIFDSYDFHRVTPVTNGVRHSIVCWACGPRFK